MSDALIIGGGLAGLVAGLRLLAEGHRVTLLEAGIYPRHKVCGEYISREVIPIFDQLDIGFRSLKPVSIDRFTLTSPSGLQTGCPLPLGGFGLSRYALDSYLRDVFVSRGGELEEGTEVVAISCLDNDYRLQLKDGTHRRGRLALACHGKRSRLDRNLDRDFWDRPAQWTAVKRHLQWDIPEDEVQLHLFPGGYCGVSKVERGATNVCYLVRTESLRVAGSLEALEEKTLRINPHLRELFDQSMPMWNRPLVISNISFDQKPLVENQLPMAGDAAGMISPLCGNGMAMAIHSGWMLSGLASSYLNGQLDRPSLLNRYRQVWHKAFGRRLWWGRQIQSAFLTDFSPDILVGCARALPFILPTFIKKTHGWPAATPTAAHA